MQKTRVIPLLLLKNRGLVKTINFKNPVYLGDPLNAVKIFNEKCVPELVLLDIEASKNSTPPDFELIADLAKECFMPLSYGGGITCVDDVSKILRIGVEKVVINSALFQPGDLVSELVDRFGSQAIIASVDVVRGHFGKYSLVSNSSAIKQRVRLEEYLDDLVNAGVGEILLTSVTNEGFMKGLDIELIKKATERVSIPVIASGGAGKISDLRDAIQLGGADAVAAGSMFVFQGRLKGILINYPEDIDDLLWC